MKKIIFFLLLLLIPSVIAQSGGGALAGGGGGWSAPINCDTEKLDSIISEAEDYLQRAGDKNSVASFFLAGAFVMCILFFVLFIYYMGLKEGETKKKKELEDNGQF